MTLSTAAQATLLLTSHFSKPVKGAVKPLTPTEWGRFAQWLHETNHTPEDLLSHAAPWVLGKWNDTKIPRDRLEALLQRGSSMALAMEKWHRSGLWVLTRSDSAYPRRLKKRLKHAAPPVLYGCGDSDLLNAGGLAVVGSRNASNTDLNFAYELGAAAAQSAITTVSGGAKGIDETAMLGALEHGGSVIGVLTDGLLKAATSSLWRQGLMSGSLVLISPYFPEVSFNIGNAMGRNKYIYCLADASLVVHSGGSGGTKTGAEENLKKGWVPLWVKPTQDSESGNHALVNAGGIWCEEDIGELDIESLFISTETLPSQTEPVLPDNLTQHEGAADQNNIATIKLRKAEDSDDAKALSSGDQLESATEVSEPPQPIKKTNIKSQQGTLKPLQIPQSDLFGSDFESDEEAEGAASELGPDQSVKPGGSIEKEVQQADSTELRRETAGLLERIDFYQFFLIELQRLARTPTTAEDIITVTGLHKSQVNVWLKQAEAEGRLIKLTRPVRYQIIQEEQGAFD